MTRGESMLFWTRVERKAAERTGKAWALYYQGRNERRSWELWQRYLRAIETQRWARRHLDDLIYAPADALIIRDRVRGVQGKA